MSTNITPVEKAPIPVRAEATPYEVTDKADEIQALNTGTVNTDVLVYEIVKNGKKTRELSYAGIQSLLLDMADRGHPVDVDRPEIKLEKFDADDKSTWYWWADVHTRNMHTGTGRWGHQQAPFVERTKIDPAGKSGIMDPHGKLKAISKATRNSISRQVAEAAKRRLLLETHGKSVIELVLVPTSVSVKYDEPEEAKADVPAPTNSTTAPTAPSEAQLKYLTNLGYKGEQPKTMFECSTLISDLVSKGGKTS